MGKKDKIRPNAASTCLGVKGLKYIVRRDRFIPAGLFALLLWILASLPGDALQRIQSAPESLLLTIILSDPFMHFFVFGFLALLIGLGFYGNSRSYVPFAKVALLVIGYGFLIEVYQWVLPWRAFGLDDLVWNTVGVLFFLGLTRCQLSQ